MLPAIVRATAAVMIFGACSLAQPNLISISGRVVASSGAVILFARVTLSFAAGGQTAAEIRTDPEGRFELTAVAGIEYRLKIETDGFLPVWKDIPARADHPVEFPAIRITVPEPIYWEDHMGPVAPYEYSDLPPLIIPQTIRAVARPVDPRSPPAAPADNSRASPKPPAPR